MLCYQWMFPGKKLLFMGGEIGQREEWNENSELHWSILQQGPYHRTLQRFVADLNHFYASEPALWEADYDQDGFFWVDCSDSANSVLSLVRRTRDHSRHVFVVLNLTPVARQKYRVGLPLGGAWKEALNSDAEIYGGSNQGNAGGVMAEPYHVQSQSFSAELTLPPLGALVLVPEGQKS